MIELEDLLRSQLTRMPEPSLHVPVGLAEVLHRRMHRRRVAVPAVAGVFAITTGGAAALVSRGRPADDRHAVVAAEPTPTPSPTARQCSVPDLIAQGGPKSMVEFRWPSGARLLSLQTPAENCPIELMLSSETLAPEDVEAAERRWGANVRLRPYDPNGSTHPVQEATPSDGATAG